MRTVLLHLPLIFLLTACMESGDPPADDNRFFATPPVSEDVPPERLRTFLSGEYLGAITAGMPMSKVENIYGSHSLDSRDLPAGEGASLPGYVLFPDSHDEVFIELGEDKQPARARFSDPRSNWNDARTGLMVGTSLRDLRRMNGGPFVFTGFGWDYGGTVNDWQGGQLEDLIVRLTYRPERLTAPLPDSLIGDVPVSSETEGLETLGLSVREIIVPIRPLPDGE